MGQINTTGTNSGSTAKLSKSLYLFSDIIKVIIDDETELQLPTNSMVTDVNESAEVILPNTFQNNPEVMPFCKTKVSSDFVELNTEIVQSESEILNNEVPVQSDIKLNDSDLKQFFFSIAGITADSKVKLTSSEINSVDKLVTTLTELNKTDTVIVQIEGLAEPLHLEVKKNLNLTKDYSVKFVFPSAAKQPNIEMPLLVTTDSEKIPTVTGISNNHIQPKSNQTSEFKILNEPESFTRIKLQTVMEDPVSAGNRSTEHTLPKVDSAKLSNIITIKDDKPELVISPDPRNKKYDLNIDVNSTFKNNNSGSSQGPIKSELLSREVKNDTISELKVAQTHPEETAVKNNRVKHELITSDKLSKELKNSKLLDNSHLQETVKNAQPSNPQKIIRLSLSKPEQINLREILSSINQSHIKASVNKDILAPKVQENIPSVNKNEFTTKLEQNLVRVNSRVSLDSVKNLNSGITIDKNNAVVQQDSFIRLSELNKPVVADKVVDNTNKSQPNKTPKPIKSSTDSSSDKPVFKEVNKPIKTHLTESEIKNENGLLKEFQSPLKVYNKPELVQPKIISEKSEFPMPKSIGNPTTDNIDDNAKSSISELLNNNKNEVEKSFTKTVFNQPKEITIDTKSKFVKNSNGATIVTDKVEESSTKELPFKINFEVNKSTFSSVHTDLKTSSGKNSPPLIAKKEFYIDDNIPKGIHHRLKESYEIKQAMDTSSYDLNEEAKATYSTKESSVLNSSEENKSSFSSQNQNQKPNNGSNTTLPNQNYEASVPTTKSNVEKPVLDSSEDQNKKQSADENKPDVIQKPFSKESSLLSKDKIVTETKNLNDSIKTIRSSEIVKEISTFVKHGAANTITFKVFPENLGKIKVSLDVADQIAKATIEVDTEVVKQIVQSNIEILKQSLTQNGITVTSINVSLAGNQEKHNRPLENKRKSEENSDKEIIETDNDSLLRKNMGYNTYEYLA